MLLKSVSNRFLAYARFTGDVIRWVNNSTNDSRPSSNSDSMASKFSALMVYLRLLSVSLY